MNIYSNLTFYSFLIKQIICWALSTADYSVYYAYSELVLSKSVYFRCILQFCLIRIINWCWPHYRSFSFISQTNWMALFGCVGGFPCCKWFFHNFFCLIMRSHEASWGDYYYLPLVGPPLTADAEVLVDRVLHVAVKAKAFSCKQRGSYSIMCSL